MNEFVRVKISAAYHFVDSETGNLQLLTNDRSMGTRGPGSLDDMGRVLTEALSDVVPRRLATLAEAVLWHDEIDDRFPDPAIAEREDALVSAAKGLVAAWKKWDDVAHP